MKNKLALPKGKKVKRPGRPPDYISKRGIPYWYGPDWVRDLNGSIGRIKPIKRKNDYGNCDVSLMMLSKTGNLSFILGSIQREFIRWHQDREIDYILLGIDEDQMLLTDWEYE